jgi:hypothetical protein
MKKPGRKEKNLILKLKLDFRLSQSVYFVADRSGFKKFPK